MNKTEAKCKECQEQRQSWFEQMSRSLLYVEIPCNKHLACERRNFGFKVWGTKKVRNVLQSDLTLCQITHWMNLLD